MQAVIVKKTQEKKSVAVRFYGTGRRKQAAARVWISAGAGNVIVNHKNGRIFCA
jgi:small subunit ribosomal protein S9